MPQLPRYSLSLIVCKQILNGHHGTTEIHKQFIVIRGPESGVGATVNWRSDHPEVGNGRQEIIESRASEFVKSVLDFGTQGTTVAYFKLDENGKNTTVIWGLNTEFGYNVTGCYFGLVLESMLESDYEAGLAKLKEVVEA